MKAGKSFWFWLKILAAILKSILDNNPEKENPGVPLGPSMCTNVLATLAQENEDDRHTATEASHLITSTLAPALQSKPDKPK